MKRIIAGSSLLFSILLATPQAYAQESVDVIIRENGTERREVIDLPKSMTYPVDSLLSDWKAKNYIDLGKDCPRTCVLHGLLLHFYRKLLLSWLIFHLCLAGRWQRVAAPWFRCVLSAR